ncbi:MAG: endolytic transglycosylase MltG [Clostridia bacterium]|nr:endolytic transglycosylase MltG [Clostridia bacterium]
MEPKANIQPKTFKKTKLIVLLLLLSLVLVFLYGMFKIEQFKEPVEKDSDRYVVVEIKSNTGTHQIAQQLYDNGLIHNTLFFRLFVRNQGLDRHLKAGKYNLSPSMSLYEIVDRLQRGQLNLISFTIPEGLTLEQIAASLERQGVADAQVFLRLAEEGDFIFPWMDELPEGPLRFEGFLFPDTYRIPEGFSEAGIIQMMLDRFKEVFTEEYEARMNELGMNILEAVTLASIIEREIRKPEEQAMASAVFHNRLNRKMRLESCATIQYALGEVKEVLSYSDLEIASPYNTYRNDGLPPGPIAAPGKGAIHAALNPTDDDYLFFVAKPDGSHHFSKTFREHEQAKNKYLK